MKKLLAMVLVLMMAVGMFSVSLAEKDEGEWHNILLMGGDSRSKKDYERTDSMIILSINREEGIMKMTSIMRDTWVEMPEENFSQKINAANVYGGPELAVKAVNECFGTDIEDYVLVNMTGLIRIIDLVGGVDLKITESERKQTNINAKDYIGSTASYSGETSLSSAGQVHMNGLLAMSYTRDRTTDDDYGRVMRQQKVLLALADSAQNSDVDELLDSVDEVMDYVETNMTNDQLKDLAMVGMTMETQDVEQFRVPADGTFDSGMFSGTWMIRPDFERNKELLHDFIYGE